ncbi:MAG: HAMP domain-containing histidine kinase [Desulfobulbaceae bacterium]|nr:HAMP domain-containing histidine kinase [Desulfobulbaceae bacterium]
MTLWSLSPVWFIDFSGSLGMIVVSCLCLGTARRINRKAPEHALASYLLWLSAAIFAFSISRSLGHIIKHGLYFSGYSDTWRHLSPVSGSINTLTFVVIGAVTLYFRQIETIMNRMSRDRDKITVFSRELLELNRDIESIVSERTRVEMGLRFAHEIRNPAMIIGGLARRMDKNMPEESPDRERLKQIVDQSEKLETLVNMLDQPEKKSSGKFEALELSALVEDVITIVQDEADRKGIIIILDRAPSPLTFQGNRHLIKIAFMHILRNGLESCASGDTIQVVTEAGERTVIAKFEDNGPGIPQEIADHIFDPFFTTREGSTGIGLPYVKQIIEEHNGSIVLSSSKNTGTLILIRLPPLLGELSRQE